MRPPASLSVAGRVSVCYAEFSFCIKQTRHVTRCTEEPFSLATQPYILSFDEAKRETRARRPSAVAPELRPAIHSVDSIPAFESPFRQSGEGRGSVRMPAHARPSGASRRSSAAAVDGSHARVSMLDRPSGRHAAPRTAPSSTRRAPSAYDSGRFASHGERMDEQPEGEIEERRLSRKEQRKKTRAKSKADRAFARQFGGSNQQLSLIHIS